MQDSLLIPKEEIPTKLRQESMRNDQAPYLNHHSVPAPPSETSLRALPPPNTVDSYRFVALGETTETTTWWTTEFTAEVTSSTYYETIKADVASTTPKQETVANGSIDNSTVAGSSTPGAVATDSTDIIDTKPDSVKYTSTPSDTSSTNNEIQVAPAIDNLNTTTRANETMETVDNTTATAPLNNTTDVPGAVNTQRRSGLSGLTTVGIVGVGVGAGMAVVLLAVVAIAAYRVNQRKKKVNPAKDTQSTEEVQMKSPEETSVPV